MAKQQKTLAEAMAEEMQQDGIVQPKPVKPVAVKALETDPVPSRTGKKHIGGYFDMTAWKQWNILRIELEGRTTQDMLEEAVNDLFLKYDKSSIA